MCKLKKQELARTVRFRWQAVERRRLDLRGLQHDVQNRLFQILIGTAPFSEQSWCFRTWWLKNKELGQTAGVRLWFQYQGAMWLYPKWNGKWNP